MIDEVRELQEEIETLRTEIEQAQRLGDLGRASEITYGRLPEAEAILVEKEEVIRAQQDSSRLLKEEVTEEDIAQVVAAWTGIPVSRLQEGERAKLVKMESRLGERVIG